MIPSAPPSDPPSLRDCRVPAGLPRVLVELGVSPKIVLLRAKLPPETLAAPRAALPVAEYFELWRAIAGVARDPTIGVRLAARYPTHLLEPALLACLGSRTLGDALDRLVRYKGTLCPEVLSIEPVGERLRLSHTWPGHRAPPPVVLVEAELAFLACLTRRATERPLSDVELRSPRPMGDAAAFAEALGAPVRFGAHEGALWLPAAALDWPFYTYSPALVAALEPALEAERARPRGPAGGPRATVRRVLSRRLGTGDVSIEAVAAELGTSRRTLQRRLRAAGTHFGAMLAGVRRERAQFYLQETGLSTAEIAFLLGFDRPSSFCRAFARWTGQTPGELRRAHVGEDAG